MTTTPATDRHVTAGTAARRGFDLRRLPLRHLVLAAVVPVLLLTLAVTALLLRGSGSVSPTAVGNLAPEFSLADLDGNPVSLAELRGRPVIVNFWASWCVPCVEEFPLLRDAAARHADDGLVIVGIVYRDRTEAARGFMERSGASWIAAMDPDERAAQAYGILGPPETYFIGRDGTIVARHLGQITASSLDEKVAAIVGED
jgi:cytochrome c biogenesis protein CcmG/thiol:disulfide interchange protein DsbE